MCEKSLLLVFAIVCLATAAPPSFITKCKKDDPKCAKESAQVAIPIFAKGLPDDKVETLDPVVFKKVDASTPNLKFILSDVTVTGLQDCKVNKLERDDAQIRLEFLCEAVLNGTYELKGKLATLPIEGNGPIHVDLKETQINVNLNIENKEGNDGKNHWNIKSWDHSFSLKKQSNVKFGNLFDGNEVLAQAVENLITSNGNAIIEEIGAPMIKATAERVVKNCQRFFKAHPVEELSVD